MLDLLRYLPELKRQSLAQDRIILPGSMPVLAALTAIVGPTSSATQVRYKSYEQAQHQPNN